MSEQDEINRIWFDASTITVESTPLVSRYFNDEVFVRLSGAFSHSTVKVSFDKNSIDIVVTHPAVRKMHSRLYYSIDAEKWRLHYEILRIDPDYSGQRLAARSFIVQARAAQELEIDAILASAKGDFQMATKANADERWAGYWVWPRLGFDGDIPVAALRRLSPRFQNLKRVSQLLASPEGEQEWLLHGSSIDVRFTPTAGSLSWQALNRYTTHRGIQI